MTNRDQLLPPQVHLMVSILLKLSLVILPHYCFARWLQNYDSCTLGGQSIMSDVACNKAPNPLLGGHHHSTSEQELQVNIINTACSTWRMVLEKLLTSN